MVDKATSQSDNIVPAKHGKIWAVTVDTTARSYDLRLIDLGQKFKGESVNDDLYICLAADGANIYYSFDSATQSDLVTTAADAVGASPPTFGATYGDVVFASTKEHVRIRRNVDHFIQLRVASGTAVLRVRASSQPGV